MAKPFSSDYMRSAFFGAEDSLVSTTGLVAGIAAATHDVKYILLAGMIAVSVEAISMSAGSYLSQKAVDEMDGDHTNPFATGLIMLVSYAVAGIIPILPMALLQYPFSLFVGVGASLVALYIVGYIKGKIVHRPAGRSGLEVLIVGGFATMIGLLVGVALKI